MKLVLSTNDGTVVNVWEDIEGDFLPIAKYHTLRPYYLLDEMRSHIMRAKTAKIARFGVVSVIEPDFPDETFEVMRELN